jgi:hypothetical protein
MKSRLFTKNFQTGKTVIIFILLAWCFANPMQAQRRQSQPSKPDSAKTQSQGKTSTSTPSLLSKLHYRPDASSMNLNGKVKSIYAVTYNAFEKNGAIIKTDTSGEPTLTSFDAAGNISTILFYKKDGSIAGAYELKYLKPGMLTERKSYLYSRNRLTEKEVYKYDDRDYLISKITHDSVGNITSQYNYTYFINFREDKYSMKTDSFYYRDWSTHKLIGIHTDDYSDFILDKDTNIISKESKLISSFKLVTYGYNGQRQKVSETYRDNSRHNGTAMYDTVYTIRYEYDVKGNVVREIPTGDAWARSYEYTYDSKGNWIKQVINNNVNEDIYFNKDDQYVINERKIVYY